MKETSIRVKILVPVLLLFVISVMSNVLAINNLRKVNDMASVIADNYLGAITELDTIGQTTKNIHTLALSHIVATDFETMTGVVAQIDEQEKALDEYIKSYQKYIETNTADAYQNMITDYQSFKESVMILLAQSANQKTKDAYSTANGLVADSSKKLNDDINTIITSYKEYASSERHLLTMGFNMAIVSGLAVLIISVIALAIAIYMVAKHVIRPVIKAEAELREIIDGINNREGDLTKRVSISSHDEIGTLTQGINSFIELLQKIFTTITSNSESMDKVVSDVLGSVQTSNSSASDLSAI